MRKPAAINDMPCPSCGVVDPYVPDSLWPYCSDVCKLLGRYELAWRTYPYRIVVLSHPHLVVQAGPRFDLREAALKGARKRALAAERKRRQRQRFNTSPESRQVTQTEQYKPPIGAPFELPGVENSPTE